MAASRANSKPVIAGVQRRLRLCEQALHVSNMGGWECDLASERLFWTEGLYRLHDIDPDTRLLRHHVLDLYSEASRRQVETIRAEAIRRCEGFSLDVEVRTVIGTMRWLRITAAIAVEEGRAVRIFGAQRDVTAERAAWDRLRTMAECDPLTGLANRAVFDARHRAISDDPVDHAGVAALILADLDRLKAINDVFGHPAGDECLREVARRFRRQFPQATLIARLGGDEFALLIPAPLDAAGMETMLARATVDLRGPVVWDGRVIDLSVSLGGILMAERRQAAFEGADEALYAAKTLNRHRTIERALLTQGSTAPATPPYMLTP